MTREEEIIVNADKFAPTKIDTSIDTRYWKYHGFIEGAQWADAHPVKSPWTSVKDGLPETTEEVILHFKDGIRSIGALSRDYGETHWCTLRYCDDWTKLYEVDYWMRIPELPE